MRIWKLGLASTVAAGRWWRDVGALEVGVGAHEGGEVASGGEADDADFVGVDVPLGGVGAGDADGLLGVLHVLGVFGEAAAFGDSVFDGDAGDADGVEPVADLGAFEVPSEVVVAAAGEDEDCGSGVVLRGRGVDGDAGLADVLDADGDLAGIHAVGVGGGVDLGAGELWRARGCRWARGGWSWAAERFAGLRRGEEAQGERRGEEFHGENVSRNWSDLLGKVGDL